LSKGRQIPWGEQATQVEAKTRRWKKKKPYNEERKAVRKKQTAPPPQKKNQYRVFSENIGYLSENFFYLE
jgi:hypothetical protein